MRLSLLVSLSLIAVNACTSATPTDNASAVVSVTVSANSYQFVSLGESWAPMAVARNSAGAETGSRIQWASSNTSVATVDNGVITAVANGTADIKATAGNASATIAVTVRQIATMIALTPTADTLRSLGEEVQLQAMPLDARGNAIASATLVWSSENSSIASVSGSGKVTAIAPGTTNVVAASEGRTGYATVVVRQSANSVSITPSLDTLRSLGATVRFTASVRDARGHPMPGAPILWSSRDASIATVAADGVSTAVANGITRVSARAEGAVAEADLVVRQEAVSAVIAPASDTITAPGLSKQLTVAAKDARGNVMATASPAWVTSNASVATVSNNGLVTAVSVGTVTIRATVGAATAQSTVTVQRVLSRLQLSPSNVTLTTKGATSNLRAELVDVGGGSTPLTAGVIWKSDQPAVATVAGGIVTAISQGVARITASAQGFVAEATVTVDDQGDLGVGFIHRTPEMNLVVGSNNPTRDGWPAVGQTVNWEANIKNWSAFDRKAVPYQWMLDGNAVSTGVVDIPAGSYVVVSLPRVWSFQRQRLQFVLDPANIIREVEERNNSLEIFTDALSVGFYVERSLYDYFAANQRRLGIGSNSWEDWAQRQIRIYNQQFENAKFPLTPNGVHDRWRLDKITIVPDGALPLAGGIASNHPNLRDRTVDLQWGFPASAVSLYSDLTSVPGPSLLPSNFFYYEDALFHELGHARYLVDVYGFNVPDGQWTPTGIQGRGSNVAILEGTELISGSKHMPVVAWEHLHYTDMPGLMNNPRTFVDEYSAAALNLIAGRRPVVGNTNGGGDPPVFLNDLPVQNVLTVRDSSGNILDGADIRVYRAGPKAGEWYGKFFDNVPDMVGITNARGEFTLGSNPFSAGAIVHGFGHANGVIIIRVAHQGRIGYGFLESWRFNMERWRGKQTGEYALRVTMRQP